jgi:hypothetical protein
MHPNRKKLIQKVMSQLPGVDEPRILVRLPGTINVSGSAPEQDAKQAAEHFQEPVAMAAVNRTIAQEVEQVWQTLEAELPRQEFLEIKNLIDGLRR